MIFWVVGGAFIVGCGCGWVAAQLAERPPKEKP